MGGFFYININNNNKNKLFVISFLVNQGIHKKNNKFLDYS